MLWGARTSTRRWRFSFAAVVGVLAVLLVGAAQAGANVYWNNYNYNEGNTIGRAAADGSNVNQSFITTSGVPLAVASDGQYVYWTEWVNDSLNIARANVDGTGLNEQFIPLTYPGPGGAKALAVDSHYVYFSNTDDKTIHRASLDTRTEDPAWVVKLETNGTGALGLAVDGQYIYWTEVNSDGVGEIGRANLDSSNVEEQFIGLYEFDQPNIRPVGIAVNSQYIYWTSLTQQYYFAAQAQVSTPAAIGRAAIDGSGVDKTFIPIQYPAQPQGMGIDAQHIYWADNWADSLDNPIMYANLDGSSLPNAKPYDVLTTGAADPISIAVDPSVTPPPPVTPAGTTTSPISPPQAFADPANVTGPMTATLHGRVGPNGQATTYRFEYGLTTGYGQRVPATDASAGAGTALSAVTASLTGLKASTTYHYRVVATSAGGTATSGDQTFTTPRACRDRIGPISRFNLKKTVITRNGLHAVGVTTDRGGCTSNVLDARDGGGVSKVMISFALQTGHVNTPLKPGMKWGKPVSVHTWTYNFVANGKHNWTFNLKMKLQPGLYRVFAMGYDLRGNREPYDPQMRNGILIRVK